MTSAVYLDHNATAPLRLEAREAMLAALGSVGNPSSVHRFGREARRVVETGRARVAALAGVAPAQIVFTGGATEANALALTGLGRRRVLVSAIEHDSALAWATDRIPVGGDGRVDLDALERMLAAGAEPAIVSIMAVNNEIGVIQPVAEAAAIARRHGALVHCDAVQAAGRIALPAVGAEVDALSLSAHKLGGPQGIGALALRDGLPLAPLLRGGAQEGRRRAGTENVAGIAGFGAAAAAVADRAEMPRIAALRDELEQRLTAEGAVVLGAGAPRVANTSCVAMPGVAAETQVAALDLAGVAVSAGSACSSGKVRRSHVLEAMGLPADLAEGAIRISLGPGTDAAAIDRCIAAWADLAHRRRSRAVA
ncbi:MAG: cysteine desulfurase [Inquilinus limosus]|uniref:Cysteine desulfurase n=1 Tax=Inquilinus limosus TaxID=171674 RepID=A0A952FJE1_9PROT|nr:cysteine desulfurase [Inquilinus limosus]